MRKKIFQLSLLAVVIAIGMISIISLFGKKYAIFWESKPTASMLCELIIFGLTSYCLNKYISHKGFLIAANLIEILFLAYIHEMLFPILVNAAYFVLIFCQGYLVLDFFQADRRFWKCFVSGISVVIILECLLSLVNIGSNRNFLLAVLAVGSVGVTDVFRNDRKKWKIVWENYDVSEHHRHALDLSIILTVFALLIGRCNLALDYDGLWYGLRPDYLLNAGNGIYEKIPAVSLPNTYPKGYEILLLPLAQMPSYSFMLAFNIFIGILILFAAWDIIKAVHKRGMINIVSLIATIPGVMSMCTTVKQDSITLLCQMIMIYYAVLLSRKFDTENLMIIFAAYFLSLNMKTTSLIFSSSILLIVLIFCIVNRTSLQWSKKGIGIIFLPICVTVLTALRTYLLCGYPYTSLLLRFFERGKFGLKAKGPYVLAEPTASMSLSKILSLDGITAALKKLFTAFCLPVKFEDVITDHLLLAWGTPLSFLLFVGIVSIWAKKRKLDKMQKLLLSMYFTVLTASVYSVASLYKNDGNYYMLFYVLSVLVFVSLSDPLVLAGIRKIAYPIAVINILIFSMTGWAGAAVFSEIRFINKGYYNHKAAFAEWMITNGKENIYHYFNCTDINKVLAFGNIAIVDRLPCLVESAEEIFAYGGSDYIASYQNFLTLLKETKTSEIYIDDSFNYSDNRIITYLIELVNDDMVHDIVQENENFILVVKNDSNSENISETEKNNFVEILIKKRSENTPV